MLVSFCLATYNRCEYLKYTIESIIAQLKNKNLDYEIVVVDSGSNDKTLEYLEGLDCVSVLNVNFFGLAKSYIHSFKNAKGKYIVNINDHMFINIENILKCLNDLEVEENISCVMNNLTVYGHGVNNRHPFELPNSNRVFGLIMHHLFIFRKDDICNFNENYIRDFWDYDFIINNLLLGKSIGLYKYVFGCEFKLNDNSGLLFDQRHSEKNNEKDLKLLQNKVKVIVSVIKKYESFIIITKIVRKILYKISYYLTKNFNSIFFFYPFNQEKKYSINRIPNTEKLPLNFKKDQINKYNKSINVSLFWLLTKLIFYSFKSQAINKSKTKNFYLIQTINNNYLNKINSNY